MIRNARRQDSILLSLMLVYGGASLLHFMHNAIYLHDYPNLPAWLTSGGVVAAWLVIASVGVLGYLLLRRHSPAHRRSGASLGAPPVRRMRRTLYSRVSRVAGLIAVTAYAVLGFGGLDHYTVAPVSAHSVAMNLTILLEAATAAVLLVFVARSAFAMVAPQAKPRAKPQG
jgi:hypothetical protein